MSVSTSFRRMLSSLDVSALRLAWPVLFPGKTAPRDDHEALTVLHLARTQAESSPVSLRQYSHVWLTERGLPSMLPDELRPAPEQIKKQIVDVTGISVNSAYPEVKQSIHDAMRDALLDALANRDSDAVIRYRMLEARAKERRALGLPRI